MIWWILAGGALVCAAIPAFTFLRNLSTFQRLPYGAPRSPVSVLIPARNEAANIEQALRSVLHSPGVELEVVVLDDGSTDGTADIVREVAAHDPRVRLEEAPPLPEGWCGKQHACSVLAQHARHDQFLFLDADVRIKPGGLARIVHSLERGPADLKSGFPHQITVQRLERWLLPLIHFVLLGFLPMWRMRRSTSPAYGAGCGQLMAVRREAYEHAGGHGALRDSLHDGLKLPRALRRAGHLTDVFDATDIARCRMYASDKEVWSGLGKNAHEGLAAGATLLPATLLLLWGQVAPLPILVLAFATAQALPIVLVALAAGILSYLPRLLAVRLFRQPLSGALAHPIAVLLLLAIQWQSFIGRRRGRPTVWRDRSYPPAAPAQEHG